MSDDKEWGKITIERLADSLLKCYKCGNPTSYHIIKFCNKNGTVIKKPVCKECKN